MDIVTVRSQLLYQRTRVPVSSSDFRQIVIKGDTEKADRLFRAAVSAFCSLVRPSRREIAQLEDLALPLFETVSAESKRYVSAALSESSYPPEALVRRLADESVDIAAPLLIRSRALTNIDLIGLIGRHGLPHARAIARRPGLDRTIADLVRALTAASVTREEEPAPPVASNDAAAGEQGLSEVERTRTRLRALMRTAEPLPSGPEADRYGRLRDASLSGSAERVHAVLADLLGVTPLVARVIVESGSFSVLVPALSAIELSETQAYLIAALLCPDAVRGVDATRSFLDQYRKCPPDAARSWLAAKQASLAKVVPLRSAI